jgi:hypothetical protein
LPFALGARQIFARSTPRSGDLNLARFFKAGLEAAIDIPSRQRRLKIVTRFCSTVADATSIISRLATRALKHIYEAGICVKHYFQHTTSFSAQADQCIDLLLLAST